MKQCVNTIYNIDAMDGLRNVVSESIDLLLTDPPYGINKKKIKGDEDLSVWISTLEDSYRVLKKDSFYLLFSSVGKTGECINRMEHFGFTYRWQTIFYVNNGMVRGSMGFSLYYPCLVFMKGKAKIKKQIRDVFEVSVSSREMKKRIHPYQKDLGFVKYMISACSKENDTVLDPFMGSGTTAVACIESNRNFCGFEIDTAFFNGAVERLKQTQNEVAQPRSMEADS